ncbi:dienelactone hydrolase family protein [Paenibacillus qinlingensis]|uniref:Peptidase n=1 Tax=Paenibacillus qinlingensis TaxID=1837343 RepID=A0ABU1NTM8_9BACL|nr:dienelactone hydrolase family protein [Paenibacillus qinlingensis]MDR6550839.1 putative peptidase [Paenibacillus qinlingensis]
MCKTVKFESNVWSSTSFRERRLPYLLFKPTCATTTGTKLPLLLYLHGAGSKGENLQLVEQSVLPQTLAETGLPFPCIVVCPQCPGSRSGWQPDLLGELLDELITALQIDPSRVYATGISMGGRGVYELAYDYGDRLAAIVPLCAFGIPNLAPRLRQLPIWAFHGDQDEVLPFARGQEMAEALQATGSPAIFTRLEGLHHDIGETVYRSKEMWEWLKGQQRTKEFSE